MSENENECVCRRKRDPVRPFLGNVIVGYFCSHCGSFEPINPKFAPVLHYELDDNALEDVANLMMCNPDERYDLIVREIPKED